MWVLTPKQIKNWWQLDRDQQQAILTTFNLKESLEPRYRCPGCDKKLREPGNAGIWHCNKCNRNYAEIELKDKH